MSAPAGTSESVEREPAAVHGGPSTPRPSASAEATVIIGRGSRFEGLLTFRGRACVDGELIGDVICSGTLELGEGSNVRGAIEVDELIVAGELEGDVTARRRIELRATARVKGALRTPQLALAEGCILEGRCETGGGVQDP